MAITDDDVYESMSKFYNYKFNELDMLTDKKSENFKQWTKNEYLSLAKRNPINALKNSNSIFFVEKDGYALGLNDNLKDFLI